MIENTFTTLQSAYDGGECPDCGEPIPSSFEDGDECDNCGHVFYSIESSQCDDN